MPREDAVVRRGPESSAASEERSDGSVEPEILRLAIISEGVTTTWPLYVAQERGCFDREGLRVEVTLTGSSVKQLEALKAGGFDIGIQQPDHVIRAVEQGSDLFMFMPVTHASQLALVVSRDVRSFRQLKGRDIAVDGARSGYALLLRKLLSMQGLQDGEYRFVEIGGSHERYQALKDGKAVASLLNSPFDRMLFASGFGSLGTTTQYFPGYAGSMAAARRSWAAANSARLNAFVRAMNAAQRWLRDPAHRKEAVALLPARLKTDAAEAAKAFDEYGKHGAPGMTMDGLRQVIDIVWDAEGFTTSPGNPEKYVDMSYWQAATR